ncbi:hypothetical protein ACTXT7_003883 [Hymenolepis weldensis]
MSEYKVYKHDRIIITREKEKDAIFSGIAAEIRLWRRKRFSNLENFTEHLLEVQGPCSKRLKMGRSQGEAGNSILSSDLAFCSPYPGLGSLRAIKLLIRSLLSAGSYLSADLSGEVQVLNSHLKAVDASIVFSVVTGVDNLVQRAFPRQSPSINELCKTYMKQSENMVLLLSSIERAERVELSDFILDKAVRDWILVTDYEIT